MFRRLNILVFVFACLSAIALTAGYHTGGHVTFAGLPIVALLSVSCGFSRRFESK